MNWIWALALMDWISGFHFFFQWLTYLILISEKPPDDPKERFLYNRSRQKFARFNRLYGNSLTGGEECAKIITVTETETKKKKGKKKDRKKVSYQHKSKKKPSFRHRYAIKGTSSNFCFICSVMSLDNSYEGFSEAIIPVIKWHNQLPGRAIAIVFHVSVYSSSCFMSWNSTNTITLILHFFH